MYKRLSVTLKKNVGVFIGIFAGALMMGAALSVFLVPFKIAPGGISGLSTVLHYLTGIRVSTLILIINAPIFILGFLNFDGSFLLRSVFGTIVLSVVAEVFSYVHFPIDDIVLSCVFGGALMGSGIATVMRSGGTTGGTDVLVLVFKKLFGNLSIGQLFMIIDGAIIVVAGAFFGEPQIILYSAAALFISSRVTDMILEGVNFAKLVYIVSDNSREITEQIYKEIKRGVTGLKSVSMYTGKEGVILLCAISRHQLRGLKEIVRQKDPNSFVMICDAKEIMGNFPRKSNIFEK